MAYKVIVWGTGFVGKMVIGELLQNPEYELVGVIGHFPQEIGRDVGELIGADPVGLESSGDVDAVLSREADAVAYYGPTAEFAQENVENICKALRAGKNVVSTAMTPWVYHKAKHCPQSQVLGDYYLGLLAEAEALAIQAHLAECPYCPAELEDLRQFLAESGLCANG